LTDSSKAYRNTCAFKCTSNQFHLMLCNAKCMYHMV